LTLSTVPWARSSVLESMTVSFLLTPLIPEICRAKPS